MDTGMQQDRSWPAPGRPYIAQTTQRSQSMRQAHPEKGFPGLSVLRSHGVRSRDCQGVRLELVGERAAGAGAPLAAGQGRREEHHIRAASTYRQRSERIKFQSRPCRRVPTRGTMQMSAVTLAQLIAS